MDHYNSRLARFLLFCNRWRGITTWAITLGQSTFYSESKEFVDDRPWWRRHENKHKQQYAEHGFVLFIVKYLWYSIIFGYDGNPFEQQADIAANSPGDDDGSKPDHSNA